MNPRLLRVRIERFQTGRPLAREIFLNLPLNRKMLCVANSGDELRSALLARLPVKGVRELYVRTVETEGQQGDPETYPLYDERAAQRGELEAVPEFVFAPTPEETAASRLAPYPTAKGDEGRESSSPERDVGASRKVSAASAEAEPETVVPADRDWLEASERFSRDVPEADVLHFSRLDPAAEKALREAVPERAELEFGASEDRFFPEAAVEELRVLDRRAQAAKEEAERLAGDEDDELERRVAAGEEEPEDGEEAHFHKEEPGYAYDVIDNTPPENVRALGARLVGVVRAFAVSGELAHSPELKEIAGVRCESARVFFNSTALRGLEAEAAARVLRDLREVKQDLRVLTVRGRLDQSSRLGKLVHEAIRVFRRGVLLDEK